MNRKSINWKAVFIICGLLLVPIGQAAAANGDSVEYHLMLKDPVKEDSEAKVHTVVLSLFEQGYPHTYSLSMQIEVCLEQICKPLDVILFWNALGDYEYLKYPSHLPLTKYDHALFTPEDYRRLDAILKDDFSLLGKHPLSFFEQQFAKDPSRVDAVTTATPPAIQDAVVKDAAYTSWALWHWANGEIVDKLLANTLELCSDDYLMHCLDSDDPRFVQFGLKQVAGKDYIDPGFLKKLLNVLDKCGRENCKLALKLLSSNSVDTLGMHRKLVTKIGINAGSSMLIISYFESLSDVDPVVWEDLAARLGDLRSYYDIFASLNLLEDRAANSEVVRAHIEGLLKSDDLNIVRRAGEFLDN